MESTSGLNKRKRNNDSDAKLGRLEDMRQELIAEVNRLRKEKKRLRKEVNEEKKKGSVYTSLDTLLLVGESKFENHVKSIGSCTSHKPKNHQEATAHRKEISLAKVEIKKLKETRPRSCLLSDFVDPNKQTADVNATNLADELSFSPVCCDHEADYAALVRNAAKDAIHMLKIFGKDDGKNFSTNMERSLFSVRPDILVVRDSRRLGVLAIEVKIPEEKDGDLFQQPKILGHVFDQAEAMRAFGKGTSIVVLTNFLESSICSVDESVFETIEGSPTGQFFQPADQLPAAVPLTPQAKTSPLPSQSPPKATSPPLISRTITKESSSSSSPSNSSVPGVGTENTTTSSLFMPEKKRIMWQSNSFKTHQLVRLIYTGLLLGLQKQTTAARRTYKLQPKRGYHVKKAIEVVEGGYRWGEFKFHKGEAVQCREPGTRTRSEFKPCPENAFYIIGELGYGSTSNVFHALTGSGDEVAIKLYLSNVDKDGKVLTMKGFKEQGDSATKMEAERLRLLYPFLKEKVKTVKLFDGHHAVVMPKFEQIKMSERNEVWMEDNVRPVLTRFAENNLKYSETDVQWRHVGLYTDDNNDHRCILYDLAELERAEDDCFVDEHFNKLLGFPNPR